MNEELTRKLIRQLKFINVWLALFGTLFLLALIALGILGWQIVDGINDTKEQLNSLKSSTAERLDVSKKICDSTSTASTFFKANTDLCT